MYIHILLHVWPFPIPCLKKKKKTKNSRRKREKIEKARKGARVSVDDYVAAIIRGGAPPFVSETCRDKRRERRLCRKAASRSNYGRTIPVIEFNCSTKEESYLIAPPLCTRRFTINPRRNIRNAINWIVNRFVSPLVPPVVLYPF